MMFDWSEVWDRKARSGSNVHQEVSGFEHLEIDSREVAENLIKVIDLGPEDTVLEIGCAVGIVARHLNVGARYVGVDKSAEMIAKTIEMNRFSALRAEANDLPFKDKCFDKVFSFGVFHYFPNYDYMWQAVEEMLRVSRKLVLIADLPRVSHDKNHLLFSERMFEEQGWSLSPAIFYRPERFDVIKYF